MVILSFHTNNPINFVGYFTCAVHNLLNLNHLKRQINRSLYYIYIMHIYIQLYIYIYIHILESGSSVGITTDYGLDGPGSNPGGEEIFHQSRPVLGAHPASCKMGTGSFPG